VPTTHRCNAPQIDSHLGTQVLIPSPLGKT
jgi:hypothetical protein